MKPTQTRIADLWCRVMHTEPMWPSHGYYECRTCGRPAARVLEQPAPIEPRAPSFGRGMPTPRGLRDCGEHAMLIVAALCVLVLSSFILSLVPCPGSPPRAGIDARGASRRGWS